VVNALAEETRGPDSEDLRAHLLSHVYDDDGAERGGAAARTTASAELALSERPTETRADAEPRARTSKPRETGKESAAGALKRGTLSSQARPSYLTAVDRAGGREQKASRGVLLAVAGVTLLVLLGVVFGLPLLVADKDSDKEAPEAPEAKAQPIATEVKKARSKQAPRAPNQTKPAKPRTPPKSVPGEQLRITGGSPVGVGRVKLGDLRTLPVAFAPLESDFTVRDQARLDQMLTEIKQDLASDPSLKVEVGGHTGREGYKSLNQQIGRERSQAGARLLVRHGIGTDRITLTNYRSFKPVLPRVRDIKADARNRRVTLRLVK
jgi:outer membrane protein OmpA-like peptidoglycan-associated protein